jgi:hypothetical protein
MVSEPTIKYFEELKIWQLAREINETTLKQ